MEDTLVTLTNAKLAKVSMLSLLQVVHVIVVSSNVVQIKNVKMANVLILSQLLLLTLALMFYVLLDLFAQMVNASQKLNHAIYFVLLVTFVSMGNVFLILLK